MSAASAPTVCVATDATTGRRHFWFRQRAGTGMKNRAENITAHCTKGKSCSLKVFPFRVRVPRVHILCKMHFHCKLQSRKHESRDALTANWRQAAKEQAPGAQEPTARLSCCSQGARGSQMAPRGGPRTLCAVTGSVWPGQYRLASRGRHWGPQIETILRHLENTKGGYKCLIIIIIIFKSHFQGLLGTEQPVSLSL